MNRLRKAVRDYLTMRRGLGFKLVRHEAGLQEFVSFLERKRSPHITVNLALEWATQHNHHSPCEWAARLSIVRAFARVRDRGSAPARFASPRRTRSAAR